MSGIVADSYYNRVWSKEEFPADWKKAVIVPLHKKKYRMNFYNYRGISLLRHFSKLFTSILLQRLKLRTYEIFWQKNKRASELEEAQ